MQRYKFIDKIFIANVNIFELWVGGVWRISRLTHFLDVESELRDLYELIRFVKNIKGCRWKTSRFAWPWFSVQAIRFIVRCFVYAPSTSWKMFLEKSVRMAGTLVLSTTSLSTFAMHLQMLNTQNDGPIKGNGRVTELGFKHSVCQPTIMSKYEIFTAV